MKTAKENKKTRIKCLTKRKADYLKLFDPRHALRTAYQAIQSSSPLLSPASLIQIVISDGCWGALKKSAERRERQHSSHGSTTEGATQSEIKSKTPLRTTDDTPWFSFFMTEGNEVLCNFVKGGHPHSSSHRRAGRLSSTSSMRHVGSLRAASDCLWIAAVMIWWKEGISKKLFLLFFTHLSPFRIHQKK